MDLVFVVLLYIRMSICIIHPVVVMTADLGCSFLKEHTCYKANPRTALGGGVVPEEGVVDAATGMDRAPRARGARS